MVKNSVQDLTCLAEGQVFSADSKEVSINLNELIVGGTGSGKTMSVSVPRMAHTFNSSLVVPIAKKSLKEKYKKTFEERGYKVIDLDFAHPENCNIGYDPMDYIKNYRDVIQTARNIIEGTIKPSQKTGGWDPYWNDSATSMLAAGIELIRIDAMDDHRRPTLAEVIELFRAMNIDYKSGHFRTNLDQYFEKAEELHPGNQATELWKTVNNLSAKTASCIVSILNNAIDKIFSAEINQMMRKSERVQMETLGSRKTILFITTSPMNKSLNTFINIMYADLFRELFQAAEKSKEGHLDIPVHIICDDFACGTRICDFEDYISIFRAAGISVSLLLQSESQLASMYGEYAAQTIINNCDTYLYMGGMDIITCKNVSQRVNLPVNKVLGLPLEHVYLFRRGNEPVLARRYQTLDDPIYKKVMEDNSRVRESL